MFTTTYTINIDGDISEAVVTHEDNVAISCETSEHTIFTEYGYEDMLFGMLYEGDAQAEDTFEIAIGSYGEGDDDYMTYTKYLDADDELVKTFTVSVISVTTTSDEV